MRIEDMSLEELQKHKVRLIDAWRESRAQYGFTQAVNDGFYKVIINEYSTGYTPADMWLTKNLEARMDEAFAREAELLSSP